MRVQGGALDSENFHRQIAVTVASTLITVPTSSVYTTTDSDEPNASYTMALYSTNGARLAVIYPKLKISPSITPPTWARIEQYSRAARQPASRAAEYNTDQVDELLDGLSLAPDASLATKGKMRVDTDPVLASDPEAIGSNNVVFLAVQKTKYLDSYASLAAALTDIGSVTATELKVTSAFTVSANTTITPNILLKIEGGGLITVASGVTLTIGRMSDPGNRQVFVQSSATANVRFSEGAVEKINIRWFLSAAGLCTNAVNQAIASATANGGGVVYFPQGAWTTAGGHAACDNLIIKGDGIDTVLTATGNGTGIFTQGAGVYDVKVKDIQINGGGFTIAGYLCSAANGDGSAGLLRFENVLIKSCEYGLRIHDTLSTEWQMAGINFDAKCRISDNTYGIWCNTTNNVIQCDAFFEVGVNQWAGYATGAGQWVLTGECAGSPYNGANQIITQTIIAAVGITGAGTAQSVVTAAGMTGSPVTVDVPVDTGMTTAALIATRFRKILGQNSSITSFFHIGGTGADIELIALDPAANDATMNATIDTGTATGITNDATAVKTANGVADTTQAQGFYFGGSHGLINFIGTQDEGFRNFIVEEGGDSSNQIALTGCSIQSAIRLNTSCQLSTTNCSIIDRSIRGAAASNAQYTSVGDVVQPSSFFAGAFRTLSALKAHNFSGNTTIDSCQTGLEVNRDAQTVASQYHLRVYHNDTGFFDDRTKGRTEVLSSVDPLGGADWVLAKWGRSTPTGEPLFYYDWKRRWDNGRLTLTGNQTATVGAVGLDFNGDITALNFRGATVSPAQITSNQNNYNPGTSAENIRLSSDASRNITGLAFDAVQSAGDTRFIQNVGSFNIVLVHQSASSTAGNRFLSPTGADITLTPNAVAYLKYDATTARWRILTASGGLMAANNLSDLASAATALANLGLTATAAELNLAADVSAYQESVTAAGALSVTKLYSGLAIAGAGAVTLAVPDASMLGKVKTIEMVSDGGDLTLALTNVVGQSSGTTATFNDVGDTLVLLAISNKWVVIKEHGVTLS